MWNQTTSFPLISVIVPIYNMSGKMELCMRCLLAQTYPNLEFLLVDDGSKDDSWERIQDWAKQDARIRPFHKENGGVSSARNYGLERMQGEYATFVDPDDAFSAQMIEWLYEALQEMDTALSVCRVLVRQESELRTLPPEPTVHGTVRKISLEEYDHWSEYVHVQCYAALYRKELLKNIRFREEISYAEDLLFYMQALLSAGMVAYLPDRLYYYVEWNDSALRSSYKPAQFTDVLVWEKVCEMAKETSCETLYESSRTKYMFACTRAFYYSLTGGKDCREIRTEAVRRLRKNWKTVLKMPSCCRKEKTKAIIAMICPSAGVLMWRVTRTR